MAGRSPVCGTRLAAPMTVASSLSFTMGIYGASTVVTDYN
jgi:hypothetical protein